ncbi:MAG TPA: polyprenyl diphosphate synthase [Gemmatimonadales bacterium]|nr:polyprenyl diphosphate synthase [Gemmatimonadales bacterium]
MEFRRLPRHLGVIPDGNRRWAEIRGLTKDQGYAAGVPPGVHMLGVCQQLGIEELSVYGFTQENVRRPRQQVAAFQLACMELAERAAAAGAAVLVVGDTESPVFPAALRPLARRRTPGGIKLNLLVNYSWRWDMAQLVARSRSGVRARRGLTGALGSAGVSRVDLVIRWGGRRRLSGFLPIQCAYADFYVCDSLWPDVVPEDLYKALDWYQEQDVTMGG